MDHPVEDDFISNDTRMLNLISFGGFHPVEGDPGDLPGEPAVAVGGRGQEEGQVGRHARPRLPRHIQGTVGKGDLIDHFYVQRYQ